MRWKPSKTCYYSASWVFYEERVIRAIQEENIHIYYYSKWNGNEKHLIQ